MCLLEGCLRLNMNHIQTKYQNRGQQCLQAYYLEIMDVPNNWEKQLIRTGYEPDAAGAATKATTHRAHLTPFRVQQCKEDFERISRMFLPERPPGVIEFHWRQMQRDQVPQRDVKLVRIGLTWACRSSI